MAHRPAIIAHRGASDEAEENTLTAFQIAIDMGIDYVECDVQLTRDGMPIISHDPKAQASFSDVYKNMPQILTFEQFLAIDFQKVGVMVEIKADSSNWETLTEKVIPMLFETKIKQLVVGSLSPHIVARLVQAKLPFSIIGIIESKEEGEKMLSFPCDYLAVNYLLLDIDWIKKLQQVTSKIWAWTVDEIPLAKELYQKGIQGIISNHPRDLLQAFL